MDRRSGFELGESGGNGLDELQQELDVLGQQYEEELLREGQEAPGRPPDELVHRFFENLPGSATDESRRSRQLPWAAMIATAAAALFLLWVFLPRDLSEPADPRFPLSSGSVVHSLGGERDGERWTRFSWSTRQPLSPTQHYEVVVRDIDGTEVDRSGRLQQPEWIPTLEQQSGWPDPLSLCVQLVWPGDREEVCEEL